MVTKAGLNADKLKELGIDKLIGLMIEEASANAAFRKRLSAALAGIKGPEAVAKLVERRLAALEKARSVIDWSKVKEFEKDLATTLTNIVEEIGVASPSLATELLLRFIATSDAVLGRLVSSNRVEGLYAEASAAVGPLADKLSEADLGNLPGKLMATFSGDSWTLSYIFEAVIPRLPASALDELDSLLAQKIKGVADAYRATNYRKLRQLVANQTGDIDKWIALEGEKPEHSRDSLAVAEILLAAGRAREALVSVERIPPSRLGYATVVDMADGVIQRDPQLRRRASLKAAILEALGNKDAAQALRWTTFEQTLDVELLRVYIGKLDDFAEFEALDKAFAYVLASKARYRALNFLCEWPHLAHAATLVLRPDSAWDGRQYDVLAPAAEKLRDEQPLAASLLYRTLIEDMLAKSRSAAYGHGARYLGVLDDLAPQLPAGAMAALGRLAHADWRAALLKAHGRKASFWAGVRGRGA